MHSSETLPDVATDQPLPQQRGFLNRNLIGWLYTRNPFYLLSLCFVIHGTAHWFQVDSGPRHTWTLMALIAGYTMMMAAAGFGIVRFGRVWDDARSIFAIVVVLFVALAVTLDDAMLNHLSLAPVIGLAGYAFAAVIVEGLLLGLRIKLPVLFRLPLHGLLGLLFLYPVLLIPHELSGSADAIVWRIYLFSPCAAISFVTFLPAVWRGDGYVRDNGTPWSWPWFPWGIIGLLAVCLGYRAYSLSLTFDPVMTLSLQEAMELGSAFGGYFLVPMLLAAALVMLEIGRVQRLLKLQSIALLIPAACFVISFPFSEPSRLQSDFLSQFVQRLASPVFLSGIAGCLFYGYAWLRKVRFAEDALMAALLVMSVVRVESVSVATLADVHPLPFVLIALVQFAKCVSRRDSRRFLAGALCLVFAFHVAPSFGWEINLRVRDFLTIQLAVVSLILAGVLFNDEFARLFRVFGAVALMIDVVVVFLEPTVLPDSVAPWTGTVYLSAVAAVSFALAAGLRSWSYLATGLISAGALIFDCVVWMLRRWPGIESFLIAAALFVVAVAISIVKAGRNLRRQA